MPGDWVVGELGEGLLAESLHPGNDIRRPDVPEQLGRDASRIFQSTAPGRALPALTLQAEQFPGGLGGLAVEPPAHALDGRVEVGYRKRQVMKAAAALSAAAALLLTQTRSSWVAMVVSAAVIISVMRRRWIPVYAAAVLAVVLLAPEPYRTRIRSIWNPLYRTNVQRLNMFRGGMSIFREHPLIGTGPVDLGDIYRQHMPPGAVHVHGHMHNIFLQVAVTLGAAGLAAFLWLLGSMFAVIGRTLRLDLPPPERGMAAGSLGAMAGFVVNGMFDWNFGDAEVLTMMLIIVGLSAAAWVERRAGAA